MTIENKEILKKMCSYVGADFNEIDFKSDYWYLKHQWTEEQENDFIHWLTEHHKKKHPPKKALQLANEFVFNYGWRTSEGVSIDTLLKKIKI